jgi:Mn2+/Fe2+ NRAMP family transporter
MAVVEAVFTPPAGRRAVLDRAHVGDVEGAFGTLSEAAVPPARGMRARLAALAAVLGPGLVIMAADNDAAGIGLLARAGEEHGTRLLWLLVALAPVVFVTQELVLRLGAVTGAGHARLIIERFGRRWGMFALGDLLALNALTLVADFVAIAFALGYFGVSHLLAAPIGAVLLLGLMATGSFRGWERMMFVLLAATVAVVPLVLLVHAGGHHAGVAAHAPASSTLVLVLALVGTTVAPWQLFVRQSNVVDKRITPRWLGYARVDTAIGTVAALLVAAGVLVACAWAFGATPHAFSDAGGVAPALRADLSPAAGAIFAVLLIDAALLGAAAVALSSSYSVGDALGFRHSLHRGPREARTFHAVYAGFVALGAAAVLVPHVPLGALVTGSQALAAILLPSATVLLLLLGNDAEILGPWVNPAWLNALGTVVVSAMLGLSTALVAHALVPAAEVAVGAVTGAALLALGIGAVVAAGPDRPAGAIARAAARARRAACADRPRGLRAAGPGDRRPVAQQKASWCARTHAANVPGSRPSTSRTVGCTTDSSRVPRTKKLRNASA